LSVNRAAPDKERAREIYRRHAATYDGLGRIRLAETVRRQAVELLGLQPGDVVIDVACGTGLSFPLIEERIGPEGRLIGVDLSAEMLAKARHKEAQAGWQNVALIEAAVDEATIPVQVDAVFFHFTHDVLRTPAALENVFRHAKPGARVVSAGGKRAPSWAVPVNVVMRRISRRYITTFEGFDRPWSHLERYVPYLRIKPVLFGAGYIAWGKTKE
jgi:demethylmenaquinone methyltransferase/2-methoxy-6-polyprenyl-1,4-benzoquinol methylase